MNVSARNRWLLVLIVAGVLLVASVAGVAVWSSGHRWGTWRAAASGPDRWSAMMGGDDRPGWRGAMMGDAWHAGGTGAASGWQGSGPVTQPQARVAAQQWVDTHAAGATLDEGVTIPAGFRFTATKAGQLVAVIMVDDDTGSGSGRLFTAPPPSPSPTGSGGAPR